jgi:hypothetical protein
MPVHRKRRKWLALMHCAVRHGNNRGAIAVTNRDSLEGEIRCKLSAFI